MFSSKKLQLWMVAQTTFTAPLDKARQLSIKDQGSQIITICTQRFYCYVFPDTTVISFGLLHSSSLNVVFVPEHTESSLIIVSTNHLFSPQYPQLALTDFRNHQECWMPGTRYSFLPSDFSFFFLSICPVKLTCRTVILSRVLFLYQFCLSCPVYLKDIQGLGKRTWNTGHSLKPEFCCCFMDAFLLLFVPFFLKNKQTKKLEGLGFFFFPHCFPFKLFLVVTAWFILQGGCRTQGNQKEP